MPEGELAEEAMTKVEKIEQQIQELSTGELSELRQWFAEFDAAVWDAEIEADVKGGKLNELAKQALHDHRAGRTTDL